ncbi:DMT family transporter [Planctomicrobium sp. SH661]|uniref:DMT family transporter n=1 Tax=Planctomicrobium sp. SH661 TaxID=3448124 RepID=UPI003F5B4895
MTEIFAWIFMCLVGALLPIQAIVNARLGQLMANPFLAAQTSFATGTVALIAITAVHARGIPKLPDGVQIPWFLLTGGLLGTVFVTAVLHFVPRLGAANVLTIGIFGQLIMSLVIDHFGLLSMPVHTASWTRVLGVGVLVLGTWMIKNG